MNLSLQVCKKCGIAPPKNAYVGLCNACLIKKNRWRPFFGEIKDISMQKEVTLRAHDFGYYVKKTHGIKAAPFQTTIINAIQDPQYDRYLIEMPRGHGKSTLFAEMFPSWYMSYNPGSYVLLLSSSGTQAAERGENTRDLFDTFPYSVLKRPSHIGWGTTHFTLLNGSRCVTAGAGAQVLGARKGTERPNLIICDDVVPQDNANMSDAAVETWFFDIISNLGGPDTKIVVIGTPYRMTDLMYKLKRNKRYTGSKGKIFHYEALLGRDASELQNPEAKVLWPDWIPLSTLQEKYDEIGALAFARNYLCRLISSGSAVFPMKYLEPACHKHIHPVYQRHFDSEGRPIQFESVIGGVDLAISAETGADYFVIAVLGVTYDNRFQLLWLERHQGLPYTEQKKMLYDLNQRYWFDLVISEAVAYQKVFTQDVATESTIPILPYYTGREKHDLEKGIPRIRTHLEHGKYIFPFASPVPDNMIVLLDEMQGWSFNKESKVVSNTEHDDTTLALWLATIGAERSGALLQLVTTDDENDLSEY